MKKSFIFLSLSFLFLFCNGCSTGLQKNDNLRITGIVDASYTKYEYTKNMNQIKEYLNSKVKNSEISEPVSFTIITCIERSQKIEK